MRLSRRGRERQNQVVVSADTSVPEFTLHLRASNRTVSVPADHSILQALEKSGVAVDSFCRNGVCGTCEQVLIAGEPVHHDAFLTDAERAAGKRIMICVSRAAPGSTLVLDL